MINYELPPTSFGNNGVYKNVTRIPLAIEMHELFYHVILEAAKTTPFYYLGWHVVNNSYLTELHTVYRTSSHIWSFFECKSNPNPIILPNINFIY